MHPRKNDRFFRRSSALLLQRGLSSSEKSPVAQENDALPHDDHIWQRMEVTKSKRFLSSFLSDVIRIDVSNTLSEERKILEINPSEIYLQCDGKKSIYTTPQPLKNFPHLCETLKLAINLTLGRHEAGNLNEEVSAIKLSAIRFFGWIMRNGIYKLSDVERYHLREFVAQFSLGGWEVVLGLDERLNRILGLAESNPLLVKSIAGSGNGKIFSINTKSLEKLAGSGINANRIPNSFRKKVAELCGAKNYQPTRYEKHSATDSALRRTQLDINVLFNLPADCIKFNPFPNASKAKILKSKNDIILSNETSNVIDGANPLEQTRSKKESAPQASDFRKPTINISVQECAELLAEALRWTYDYSTGVLEVVEYCRARLEGLPREIHQTPANIQADIFEKWEEVAHRDNIPQKSIRSLHLGNNSLTFQVKLLMYAQFVAIGICSGRRPGEIQGLNKPWGIYYGAVQALNTEIPAWDIDIYIEKSIQNYGLFPANIITKDSVLVLERLFNLMRKSRTPPIEKPEKIEDARKMKLFSLRTLSAPGFAAEHRSEPSLDDAKKKFLEAAKIDSSRYRGSNTPFRRIFCTIHMHRYDLKELPALSQYLGHFNFGTTFGYYSDRGQPRFHGESIRELHALPSGEADLYVEEIRKAGVEYFVEIVKKLLNGEHVGGIFPTMIYRLTNRLSRNVDFSKLNSEQKSRLIAERMGSKGYHPTPLEHVVCFADSPKHNIKSSNCYSDGNLRREDSSEELCTGCNHSCRPESYIEYMKSLAVEAGKLSRDTSIPQSIREAHARRAVSLSEVVDIERKIAMKSSIQYEALEQAWSALLEGKSDANA